MTDRERTIVELEKFQREVREKRGVGSGPGPELRRPATVDELLAQLEESARVVELTLSFDLQEVRRLDEFTRAIDKSCDLVPQLEAAVNKPLLSERLPPEELADIGEDVLRAWGDVKTLCRRSKEVRKIRDELREGVRRARREVLAVRDRVRRIQAGYEKFTVPERRLPAGLLVERVPKTMGPFFGAVLQQFDKQGRILNPPPPGPSAKTVRPTRQGLDLENVTRTRDAHVRLDVGREGREIFVAIFDSSFKDPVEGYIESDAFRVTRQGAAEATEFLRSFAFDVRVQL